MLSIRGLRVEYYIEILVVLVCVRSDVVADLTNVSMLKPIYGQLKPLLHPPSEQHI